MFKEILVAIKEIFAEANKWRALSFQKKQYDDKVWRVKMLAEARYLEVFCRLKNWAYIIDDNGRKVPVNLAVVHAQAYEDAWKQVMGRNRK